jgi:hypothetical protein
MVSKEATVVAVGVSRRIKLALASLLSCLLSVAENCRDREVPNPALSAATLKVTVPEVVAVSDGFDAELVK